MFFMTTLARAECMGDIYSESTTLATRPLCLMFPPPRQCATCMERCNFLRRVGIRPRLLWNLIHRRGRRPSNWQARTGPCIEYDLLSWSVCRTDRVRTVKQGTLNIGAWKARACNRNPRALAQRCEGWHSTTLLSEGCGMAQTKPDHLDKRGMFKASTGD